MSAVPISIGAASIHASAVRVGDRAILIRGPSGAGKSRLVFDLILAGRVGQIPPATLVGDDRVFLDVRDGRVCVRPVAELAGLLEIRGLGIRRCAFAAEAVVGLVVDLAASDGQRLPSEESLRVTVRGVCLPRIPVTAGFAALPLIAAFLTTTPGDKADAVGQDCSKGIGNHISPTIATK